VKPTACPRISRLAPMSIATTTTVCYPNRMETQMRIAQWENMTQADPDNDMGWFSLANAYRDAERLAEAEQAYAKSIELNPAMTRAFQLRGQVLMKLDRNDEAAEALTLGHETASKRGDVMPMRAMAELLEKLGKPVPQVQKPEVPAEVASGDAIIDRRSGRVGARLPDPPMRGPLGKFIYDHFTQDTWREWIGMGTKVINELRLDFSVEEHRKTYDQQMMEWLSITEQDLTDYAKQSGQDEPTGDSDT
jgi:Fe-S cluster biosynthesis and repair protein YggX